MLAIILVLAILTITSFYLYTQYQNRIAKQATFLGLSAIIGLISTIFIGKAFKK
ncbi:MAG: hypothetical protein NW207_03250 [Cytophagales bacterium]|nr:hypothetical protein [Cytophagales bacterium]